MQALGLTASELAAYHRTLSRSHVSAVDVQVLDMSGNLLRSIRPEINSGQVDVDGDADVTRSATLAFRDESRALQFNADSASGGAIYFDNMVKIRYAVDVPTVGRVWAEVFTGPLVKLDRTGDDVSVEAQGKDALARSGVPTLTIQKGANAVNAIRTILSTRCGETQFAFPALPNRLPSAVVVSWEEETWPWVVCKKIASSIGLQLFYDGAGVCRLRDLPSAAAYTFADGEGGNITSPVQLTHTRDEIRNRVTVVGSKSTQTATVNLPSDHPFSAQRLARNGVPLYLRELVTDDKIRSTSAALARANAIIKQYDDMSFGASLSSLPVPHLDELDMVRVDTDEYVGTERLRQWSFPLTGGEMSVGYNDVVSVPRSQVRVP